METQIDAASLKLKAPSFKRSISVRVEEKVEEPEVGPPCPTPTIQEIDAMFGKELDGLEEAKPETKN